MMEVECGKRKWEEVACWKWDGMWEVCRMMMVVRLGKGEEVGCWKSDGKYMCCVVG